jgi:hypothetical protein
MGTGHSYRVVATRPYFAMPSVSDPAHLFAAAQHLTHHHLSHHETSTRGQSPFHFPLPVALLPLPPPYTTCRCCCAKGLQQAVPSHAWYHLPETTHPRAEELRNHWADCLPSWEQLFIGSQAPSSSNHANTLARTTWVCCHSPSTMRLRGPIVCATLSVPLPPKTHHHQPPSTVSPRPAYSPRSNPPSTGRILGPAPTVSHHRPTEFDQWAAGARWGWDPLPSAVGQKASCSWALSQADLQASVDSPHWHSTLFLFPFGLIWIPQIMFKPLAICSNSNKFNKNINSIPLLEYKSNIWNKIIK